MGFKIPEDIKALDRAERDEAIKKARAEAKDIDAKGDDLSDADVERLEALADFIAAATTVNTEEAASEQARKDRIAAARAKVGEEPEPEPEPEVVEEEVVEEEPVKEPVAASAAPVARRTGLAARAAAGAPPVAAPVERPRGTASIVASADALGLATGQRLDSLDALIEPASKRFAAMPRTGHVKGRFDRYPLATIEKGRIDDLHVDNAKYRGRTMDLLRDAGDETRLPGGSLTAAAGWCAPSETLYDLCPGLETNSGIWDVPEIGVSRGGINFTKGPDISDVFNHAGFFHFTEAQVEAGVEKPCFTVPCPDFEEVRLDARGLCIKAGILQNAGYPEIIRRYIDLSLIAHEHQTSAWLLTQAQALAGAAVAPADATLYANTRSIFASLELLAMGERERLRMSETQTLEVVAPFWVKAAVRHDLAAQFGAGPETVTDAIITAMFTALNLRVQFVYNYQPLPRDAGGNVIRFPSTVEFLVYPAGTFVKGTQDVITLEAVYDTTNLANNEYTALFTEEGVFLANTCYDAKRIVIPVHVTGRTSAGNINLNNYGNAGAGV